MKKRIWEIDFLRGVAIILMVVFHLVYDLKEFYSYPLEYTRGFWYYEGKISAIMFMLLSGISATLARSSWRRGFTVFGYGMILTAVTFFYNPEMYIRFGILHLLGFSMILHHYIGGWKKQYLLAISVVTLALGNIFGRITVKNPYLFPLGLMNSSFSSFDYYPILPWLGVFILGVILGKTLYPGKESLLGFYPKFNPISYLGRHSLFIYLVHQPVLLALLFLYHGP